MGREGAVLLIGYCSVGAAALLVPQAGHKGKPSGAIVDSTIAVREVGRDARMGCNRRLYCYSLRSPDHGSHLTNGVAVSPGLDGVAGLPGLPATTWIVSAPRGKRMVSVGFMHAYARGA